MDTDPYFWTQDNGAGGPVHFATTYKQIDMLHHIVRNCRVAVNQRDTRGFTPLHRAAYLAQYDGYLELYEYLLSEGADPLILTEDYDPYLNPGRKMPVEVAIKDGPTRDALRALNEKYAETAKVPAPHRDIGDWWALYDYGPDAVYAWPANHKPSYPEQRRNERASNEKREWKLKRKAARESAIAIEVAKREKSPPVAQIASLGVTGATATPATAMESSSTPSPDSSPTAFLFPGQGSQAVGMLQKVKDLPAVKEMCQKATEILGYDLLDVCINGPKEKLDDTVFAQPALFLAGLAAVEKLKAEDPSAVENCSRTAGLSLGEYTALVFAGAMSFEDGLKVVKIRAEAMKAAAAVGDHGMLSVVGLDDDALRKCVAEAKVNVAKTDCVCEIANYLFPTGRVVSGDIECLNEVTTLANKAGALKTAMLQVSGAFHTSRMLSAKEALEKALTDAKISQPRIPVYSNVTGEIISDFQKIPEMLAEQLVSPVRWEDTLRNLLKDGKDQLYELGPKTQIKSMTKRVSQDAWKKFTSIDVA